MGLSLYMGLGLGLGLGLGRLTDHPTSPRITGHNGR